MNASNQDTSLTTVAQPGSASQGSAGTDAPKLHPHFAAILEPYRPCLPESPFEHVSAWDSVRNPYNHGGAAAGMERD